MRRQAPGSARLHEGGDRFDDLALVGFARPSARLGAQDHRRDPRSPAVGQVGGDDAFGIDETIFGLRERPEHLLIAGGGSISVEMAQAHHVRGSRITAIEGRRLGAKIPNSPPSCSTACAEGVEIVENALAGNVVEKNGRITARTGPCNMQESTSC